MQYNKDLGLLFPYVRFFNASPQGGSLDFYIGNTLVAAGIRFGSFTPYIKLSTGPVAYKMTRAGRKEDVVQKIIMQQNVGDVYTLCAAGKADNPQFMTIDENAEKINMDYGHLRICNLSPEDGGFDVYASDNKILGDINFKEVSRYMEIRPETYDFSVYKNQKKVLNCGRLKLKSGKFNTLYIIGLESEIPYLTDVFSIDASSYNGFYL